MNKYRQTIMGIMIIPLIMVQTSCTQDDDVETRLIASLQNNAIAFAPAIAHETGGEVQTRVSTDAAFNSTWEDGDAVGIFAVSHASGADVPLATAGNYIDNAAVKYNAGAWTTLPAPLYYYPANGNQLDFYACYPRQGISDATAMTFTVQTDQSTAAGFSKSDLMLAKQMNVASPTNPVPLTFHHAMAMIQVEIRGVAENDITGVSLQSDGTVIKTGVSIDWTATLPTTATETAQGVYNIKMYRATGNTFRALVPPQTLSNSKFLIERSGGKQNVYNIQETLTQGSVTKLVIFSPSTVQIPAGTNSAIPDFSTPGFFMDKFEVTKEQFCEFLNATNVGADRKGDVDGTAQELFNEQANGRTPRWDGSKWYTEGTPNTPMGYVAWYGAIAYAKWAGGRLPTMQEWEYACRAGTTTWYFFGDLADESQVGNYAWYVLNSGIEPHPVGQKLPNPWGLYDIYGNVREWTSTVLSNSAIISCGGFYSSGTHSQYRDGILPENFVLNGWDGVRVIYDQE